MSTLTSAQRPAPALEPIPAGTPDDSLPRSGGLTDALLAGPEPDGTAAQAAVDVAAVGERLVRGLVHVVERAGRHGGPGADAPAPPGSQRRLLRIGHYQVARALTGPGLPRQPSRPHGFADTGGFRWTPRTARRSIGLAALRAGLDGRAPTPADAVALVMCDPGGPFGIGRAGPGSCADWVTALAPPARSLVAAEATAWATRLWTGIDWGRLDPNHLVVGAPDRWWRWTGTSHDIAWEIAVRGRADVRLRAGDGSHVGVRRGGVHLVVLDGHPGIATRHALLLSALVVALSKRLSREAVVPRRVVGWWPECGKAWAVAVDARALAQAADAVVITAALMLGTEPSVPSGSS